MKLFDVASLGFFDVRRFLEVDGEEDDLVVQRLVVFEVVEEGERESVRVC